MPIRSFPKGQSHKLSENFKSTEFDCPCPNCTVTLIDEELIQGLQRMRNALKEPIVITSGYRCKSYHDDLEKRGYETAKRSMHLFGRAADLKCSDLLGAELEACARGCGFLAVGVGKTWIHVDTRGAPERRWFYKARKE